MHHFLLFIKRLPPFMLTAVCGLAILYLTLVPKPLPDNELQMIPGMDKVVHAIMFGGFALCLCLDASRKRNFAALSPKQLIVFGICSAVFGAVIEVLQSAITVERSGDVADLVADIAGVAVFIAATPLLINFFRKKG